MLMIRFRIVFFSCSLASAHDTGLNKRVLMEEQVWAHTCRRSGNCTTGSRIRFRITRKRNDAYNLPVIIVSVSRVQTDLRDHGVATYGLPGW